MMKYDQKLIQNLIQRRSELHSPITASDLYFEGSLELGVVDIEDVQNHSF